MDAKRIVVLEGDETGQELLEEALRVLAPEVTGVDLEFTCFDLSLESRRATKNGIVHEAAAALREAGLGLKAATITPEGADDVGSPNRILREEIGGSVIVRTGRRIPGVAPLGGVHAPISIVRMAVGGAYGAKEWREGEGDDEAAFRTERIERSVCRAVAEFAFQLAERTGAKVFGGPKYTVIGSIAGSESMVIALDESLKPRAVMAEAAHGTAPSLRGKDVANPMAMILAGAALLGYGDEQAQRAGRAIREASLEAVADGVRTADLGGYAGTREFTDEVIRRTRQKLEVWAAL